MPQVPQVPELSQGSAFHQEKHEYCATPIGGYGDSIGSIGGERPGPNKSLESSQPRPGGKPDAASERGAPIRAIRERYGDSIRRISFLLFLTMDSRFTAPPFV